MLVIAGATGHVGGAAASALLEEGNKIRVLVRDAAKGEPWSAQGAEVAVGNLEDCDFLTSSLDRATGFFTLLPADLSSADFYGDQRRMAHAIAAAVRESGVPHVVLLSSHGAELKEGTGPVKVLHLLENLLRETGTQLTVIRSGYQQENVANVLVPARDLGIFPNLLPADEPIRMVATKDVGALAARLLVAPPDRNEIIDIQGPAYTMREVAGKLGDGLGRQLQVVDIPRAGWIDALTGAGMSLHIADVFAEMYAAFADGRFVPRGDRFVEGTTAIDEVIAALTRG